MKSFWILSIALASFALACKTTEKPQTDLIVPKKTSYTAADSFSVEKTACFGKCPVFRCVLHGDGTAMFYGKKFVKNIGIFSGKMPVDSVATCLDSLQAMGFMELKDSYLSQVKDLPTVIVTYKGKTVKGHTRDLPAPFNALVKRVDALIESTEWNSEIKQ